MSWDARDRGRYEDEVLAPARLEGPPADLFVRYGIGPALERQLRTDPEAFTAHVERVCTHWRGLRLRRRALKKVLVDLVAAHDRLDRSGHLTHEHFAAVREQERVRSEQEWGEVAGSLTTSLLERAELRGMVRSVGIDERRAERVLAERGVCVVEDLPRLPVRAPVPTFRTLRENLRTCGAAFSPEVVFGPRRLERGFTVLDGFRLADGAGLDEEALAKARAGLGLEPLTDGKAAAENVLSILRADGDRDVREAVVLWEIVCDLRGRPAALSESGLVRPWVRLGLDEREAHLLAAAVRQAQRAAVDLPEGRASSDPVVREPVVPAPDVADLRLRSGRYAVTASWRVPEEAVRVEVLRGRGAPPRSAGDGVEVPTDGTGFQDHAVEPGIEYFYRIRAVYLASSGRTRSSEGLVLRAAPGPGPLPVSDLAVAHREEDTVVSWPSSARGRVRLWVGRCEPAWEAGTRLSEQDLAAFGDEVVEPPGPVEGGRTGVRVPVPAGTSHVLAVTVAGDQRVAGAHCRITRVPRVEGLRAQRFGPQVGLAWTWPAHASSALVEWRPVGGGDTAGGRREGGTDVWIRRSDDPRNGHPGEPEDSSGRMFCSRRPNEREGGFEVPMGPGPVEVSVRTVMPDAPGEAMSAPVRVGVPGAVVVAYRVEAVGWWRRERAVHLTAETSGAVPEIAVVHAPGHGQPQSVAQGQVLATFPAGERRAGEHTQVRVRPPRGADPGWLMCLPVPELEGPTRARLPRPSEQGSHL